MNPTAGRRLRQGLLGLGCVLAIAAHAAAPVASPIAPTLDQHVGHYLNLPGGTFRSVLPDEGITTATVAPYKLRDRPVTNAEFQGFVRTHPAWQRDAAPPVFAGHDYLASWSGPSSFGPLDPQAPVVRVSWFAARAYCDSEHARLPTWHEWEFAAAADETRTDARGDPAWRSQILSWYARPGNAPPGPVGSGRPNVWGAYDLHQLVWEWVDDFNALFVNADSRSQGEQKLLDYCGAGALSLGDRDNYAVLMRVALLAALEGNDSGANLGFRCAQDAPPRTNP